jgi:hypothetical protein
VLQRVSGWRVNAIVGVVAVSAAVAGCASSVAGQSPRTCRSVEVLYPERPQGQPPGVTYQALRDAAASLSNEEIRAAGDCDLLVLPRHELLAGDLASVMAGLGSEAKVVAARGYIHGDHRVLAVGLGFDPDQPLIPQLDEQLRHFEDAVRENLEVLNQPEPEAPDMGDGVRNEPPQPGSDDGATPPVSDPGAADDSARQAALALLDSIADNERFLAAIQAGAVVLHVIRLQASPDFSDESLAALRQWGDVLPVAEDQWPLGVEVPVDPMADRR